jgi:hypothetical protein
MGEFHPPVEGGGSRRKHLDDQGRVGFGVMTLACGFVAGDEAVGVEIGVTGLDPEFHAGDEGAAVAAAQMCLECRCYIQCYRHMSIAGADHGEDLALGVLVLDVACGFGGKIFFRRHGIDAGG